jgi:Heterokaryon incompatibility protein (HET)
MCSLEVAYINHLLPYKALCYCWGNASDKIVINYNSSQGLAITKNLHAALLALRLPNHERLLWADAICMNQDDDGIEKRGSQRASATAERETTRPHAHGFARGCAMGAAKTQFT